MNVLDNVQSLPLSGSVAYDVSASGSLVYIPAERIPIGDLLWLDRQGRVAAIPRQPRSYIAAALDPGGRRLAAAVADVLGEADLWIYDLVSGGETRLTTGMQVWSFLAWSPDGKWIFFTSFKSGNAEVFRVPSAGGSADQLTFDVKYWEYPTSVSPDGKTLLFWRTEPRRCGLMLLNLEPSGPPMPLKGSSEQFCESNPQVSPAGRWVAYESNASGSNQIHVRPLPGQGGDLKISTRGGTNPIWSRDGGELFFQLGSEIWVVKVEPGETFRHRAPRLLFKADFPQGSTSYLASGPVADRFLAVRREPPDFRLVYVPNWLEELQQALRQTQ